MGKITVQHYLNTNLKPYIVGEDKYYKIYVLIRANNKNTKLKSFITDDEYTINEYNEVSNDEASEVYKFMKIEIDAYASIIEKIETDKKTFDIQTFNSYLQNFGKPILQQLVIFMRWLKEVEISKIDKGYTEGKRIKERYDDFLPSQYVKDRYDEEKETNLKALLPQYIDFKAVNHCAETLKEFISQSEYEINNDMFIYHWLKESEQDKFSKFYNNIIERTIEIRKEEKEAKERESIYYYKETRLFFEKPCLFIEYVNDILGAIIGKEGYQLLI